MDILLSPPIAFLLYVPLVIVFLLVGRMMAPGGASSAMKKTSYGSGEEAPTFMAAPGYQPFFLVAFFFAILHLGMLVLGVSGVSQSSAVYIVGLGLALLALILG